MSDQPMSIRDCFHCETRMEDGAATFTVWGERAVPIHRGGCKRDDLAALAMKLGCFDDVTDRTDQQLVDAIAAEKLSAEWLDRVSKLPEEVQHAAFRKLSSRWIRGS